MRRPVVTIPKSVYRPMSFDWDIDWRGQSAGATVGGMSQTVVNAFPRWVGEPTLYLRGAAIATWQAVRAAAQGQVGVYLVEMCDPAFPRGVQPTAPLTWSNGATWSTGAGWARVPFYQSVGNAAIGATQIRVDVPAGVPVPIAGQIVGHGLLPTRVTSVETISATRYRLHLGLPLRAAVAAGDAIRARGVGLFEAVSGETGRLSYNGSRAAQVTLSLREWLR